MKRRILIGVFLATMVVSLAGCSTSKETKTTSGSDVKIEQSNDKSKKLLEDASFTLDSFYGLSYYALPKESYKAIRETTRDKEKAKYPSFDEAGDYISRLYRIIDGDYIDVFALRYYDSINDVKVSSSTIELIMSKLNFYIEGEYDKSNFIETDSMFLYVDKEEDDNGFSDVFIMVKDTYDIYEVYFNDYKHLWTEETYKAVINTLRYVK